MQEVHCFYVFSCFAAGNLCCPFPVFTQYGVGSPFWKAATVKDRVRKRVRLGIGSVSRVSLVFSKYNFIFYGFWWPLGMAALVMMHLNLQYKYTWCFIKNGTLFLSLISQSNRDQYP